MKYHFRKRMFSAATFFGDVGYLLLRLPRLVGALRNREIGSALREKLMLVITGVNECGYCSWFHAKQAVANGVPAEEVVNLLKQQFQADASPFELGALLYAQHFAETNRKPDADMTARLFDSYGEKTAKHIVVLIRAIFFGNLLGNTWDGVVSRFRGKPANDSSVAFECVFFALVFWFMWIPPLLTRERAGRSEPPKDAATAMKRR